MIAAGGQLVSGGDALTQHDLLALIAQSAVL
ncbi:hypothetical protein N040_13380 [Serratia marcescens EGD-HP20]|nr:hypothetical protein N040_13380 [Serratia marcescens EGD-HP20]